MNKVQTIQQKVEECYRNIHKTRMDGIPILNDALEVRLLGLRPIGTSWVGTLVTPWFMNFILLPEKEDDAPITVGTKRTFSFPSGSYEFIRSDEHKIGSYWMCSLFSPVLEFSDQETAELCGVSALNALFDAPEEPDESEIHMASLWRGELPEDDGGTADIRETAMPIQARDEKPEEADDHKTNKNDNIPPHVPALPRPAQIDRRSFLRGHTLRRSQP